MTTRERWQGVEGERWTSKPRLLGTSRDPPQHLERTRGNLRPISLRAPWPAEAWGVGGCERLVS